jgi:hypothetical protein
MTRWVHGISPEILRAAFREYFGVANEHAEILVALYARPNEWTPMKRLQVLLNSHRPPKRQTVYERVRVLREAMEPESMLSGGQLDDTGYALSELGFAECTKALRALVEALLRSGPQITIPAIGDGPISPYGEGADELANAIDRLEAERPPATAITRDRAARAPMRSQLRKAS